MSEQFDAAREADRAEMRELEQVKKQPRSRCKIGKGGKDVT
ncbi:hypothetical protein [Chromobacterium violaceum]|nr:hypothetical protein [Chromobacterium violaceum]